MILEVKRVKAKESPLYGMIVNEDIITGHIKCFALTKHIKGFGDVRYMYSIKAIHGKIKEYYGDDGYSYDKTAKIVKETRNRK